MNYIPLIYGKLYVFFYRLFKKDIFFAGNLLLLGKLKVRNIGTIVIGKNCTILKKISGSKIHTSLYTHSKKAKIKIGNNCIFLSTTMSSYYQIEVGDDSYFEETKILDTDFHSIGKDRKTPVYESKKNCKIVIGKRVSCCSGSIITKGVTIGDDAVIGPGAIVVNDVKPGSYVIGNPAKEI